MFLNLSVSLCLSYQNELEKTKTRGLIAVMYVCVWRLDPHLKWIFSVARGCAGNEKWMCE